MTEQPNIIFEDNSITGEPETELMKAYLRGSIKAMNVSFEQRNDRAIIATLKYPTTNIKNVFIYWPTSSSVAVIILGLLPKKTYYTVKEIEKDQLAEKIKSKYSELVG